MENHMKTHIIGASALLVLSLAIPASAAPLSTDTIPAQAAVVAHIDLDAIRASATYGVVTKTFAKEVAEAKSELKQELAPFDIGILLDASGVSFWAKGDDSEDGAVIFHGINTKLISGLVDKIPGHKETKKRGLTIHTMGDEGAFALVGSRVVLGKSAANVSLTVDVIEGRAKSVARNRSMPSLSGTRGSLFVAAIDAQAAKALRKHTQSALLSKGSIQGAVFQVGEHRGDLVASLTVDTSGKDVAKKLTEVAQGGMALISLAADEPELKRLLSGLSITNQGTSVTAELSMDPATLLGLAKNL